MESTEENKEQQPKGLQKHNIVDDRQPLYINIESLIYIIREEQVMLDSDLAKLYEVETKVLNQAVKRNIQRFPSDFMFQLTKEECLRSQIVTLNEGRGKHLKYMPYAFTEKLTRMSIISDIPSKTSVRSCSLSQKWM